MTEALRIANSIESNEASKTVKAPKAPLTPISPESIKLLIDDFQEMGKELFSLKEAVERLRPYIDKARANGYTIDDIAKAMEKRGITVDLKTLKRYLSEAPSAKSS